MIVNELPARTFRWLKLNDFQLDVENVEFNRFEIPLTSLPAGVSASSCSALKAREALASARLSIDKSPEEAVGPNGDTSPRHSGQLIRTGMGIDVDDLFDRLHIDISLIKAEESTHVSEPVLIHDYLKPGENALAGQLIIVPEGSSLTVIMDYSSADDSNGVHGISTKFYVGKDATLNLVKVQMHGKAVCHFDDIGGIVDEDGKYNFTQIELGANRAVTGSYITLLGNNSESSNSTGYLQGENQLFDFNYVVEHRGMKTSSQAIFRGVLDKNASKSWRGTLDFKEGSKGSVGDEQEDTLLLSDDVINRSIPVILCKEEVVDGRHGASIGQLSDDMLFYMESRGIDKETAQRIMVRARLDSISRLINNQDLEEKVSKYLDQAL